MLTYKQKKGKKTEVTAQKLWCIERSMKTNAWDDRCKQILEDIKVRKPIDIRNTLCKQNIRIDIIRDSEQLWRV